MLRSLPTASPHRSEAGELVHYRQASPELGPAQRIPLGEPNPEGERRPRANPCC